MEIRRITINDLDRVFELLNTLYENKLKYEKFKEIYKLKLNDENSYYIVATEENKIIGILTSELQVKLHRSKKQSFIEDLIVDKDYRNKGIGKALLQNAVDYAKNNNCEVIELTSYIKNENAHRFYENNNFIKHSYKFKQYL
jgi:ribosomal protein S18 acetylase RimI-like enzyme